MRTCLFEKHRALGAKIVDFSGWEMPVQYRGIIEEHKTVREKVGIFDVSHMGRVVIKGEEAEKLVDFLSTNKIAGKSDFSATYTVWCNPSGGAVDDLIVYKQELKHFFVVVNASNRKKDLNHLKTYAKRFQVEIEEKYDKEGILALQGPKAAPLFEKLFEEAKGLKPMRFTKAVFQGEEIIISKTGYTGAGGVEIYAPKQAIVALWDKLLDLGKAEGICPVGLGARDTLRLEMGYALYGHELSETIAPIESVSFWTVKDKKPLFLGKEALQNLSQSEKRRRQYGVVLIDKGIARQGCEVYQGEKKIGQVTSGTMSPSLQKAVAIIMVESKLEIEDNIQIQVRGRKCSAKVVELPFYRP